ncbi:MAG: amidohydrolase family protein [Balneolaceae bacterium]|jgi:hypothetical protein
MKLARITVLCSALMMIFFTQGWSQSSPAEAFKNVTIHTADGKVIKGGTVVWRNGIITSVGRKVSIPFDAYVRDGGDSLHVYPGFIDGLALWGSPDIEKDVKTPDRPGEPGYERAGIQPQRHPRKLLNAEDDELKNAQKYGFTTAALALKGQMLPGQVDLFFMDGATTADHLIKGGIGVLAQFEEALGSAYPSTTMGLMAQYRQLFDDAGALKQQEEYFASASSNYPAPKKDEVLESLYPVMGKEQPFYFVVDSKENMERLFWLQDEIGFNAVIISGKEAYKQADELKRRNIPILASIEMPRKTKWMKEEDKEKKKETEKPEELTEEMKHFRERQEEAYKAKVTNIKKLLEAGVKVGYASNGLKLSDIAKNVETLKKEGGLTDKQILNLYTQSTADILGYGQKTGDLKQGRLACFTVFTKPFDEEKTQALYSVSDGKITEIEPESSK